MLTGVIIHLVSMGFTLGYTGLTCGKSFNGGEVRGLYIIGTNEIYICDSGNKKQVEYYTNHEFGHYVWFNILTDKEREGYKKLYLKALKKGLGAFPSEYAMTNVEESFAEDYARWKLNPNSKYLPRISYLKKVGK